MIQRLFFILTLVLATVTATAEKPPNVILIISDDQAWTDFGFMGHPNIETPNIDQLARESLVFTKAYVPSSLCCPSLATIITGRYPFEHGITGNEPPRPNSGNRRDAKYQADLTEMINLIDRSPTIPNLLKAKGYRSFQSGKWWLGDYTRGGFTHGMTHGDATRGGRHGDEGLTIGRTTMQPIFDFIKEAGDNPFFVWYAPFLPHTPHNPPAHLVEKYSKKTESIHIARYWAMCEWFDSTCGELLDHLEETGQAENTIVLFVTDNGWIQRPNAAGFEPRSKRSPYEGGIRTPIMIRWPHRIVPQKIEEPVSSIDIAPTILKASGVMPPPHMSGVDLLDHTAVADRKTIFGDVHLHNAIDIHDPSANVTHRWCISDGWKLIVPNEATTPQAEIELFNLDKDPHETTNLANENPARIQEMIESLNAWWPAKSKPRPPNILFLLTDDQRVDMVGHITPVLQTPTMDQLAKEGVRFRNAFVTTSICAASRASIFTGLVERTHGYTFGTPPLAERFIAESYPVLLREAGYRTGFVGKFGVRVSKDATQKMFDSFVPLRPAPYLKPQPDGTTRHLTDITADRAIEFVRDHSSDQPFCLSVSFNAPHAEDGDKRQYIWPDAVSDLYVDDVIPPAPLSSEAFFETQPQFLKESLNRVRWKWRFDTPEKYQRMVKGYYRMISGVDAAIARIIDELDEQNLAANTIIILTSDNGYFLNERGFAGKWLPYDISLRVPLIVYDPRASAESASDIIDEIALNIDVAATILDYAGLQPPQRMQGQSLLPLVSGQTPATWRTDFFCEHLMNHAQIPKHEGVRNQRYRYSRYFEQNPVVEELYDLKDDPQETRNLIDDENYDGVLKMMRARCDQLSTIYQTASEERTD